MLKNISFLGVLLTKSEQRKLKGGSNGPICNDEHLGTPCSSHPTIIDLPNGGEFLPAIDIDGIPYSCFSDQPLVCSNGVWSLP